MLTTYDQALERILTSITLLQAKRSLLQDSLGRVLTEDLIAPIDLPPFDNSAMDGYAVRAADTAAASSAQPVALSVVMEIAAGSAVEAAGLRSRQAARIFTGGVVPPGADAIVPIEDTQPAETTEQVRITTAVGEGEYLRKAGGDLKRGVTALLAGIELRPYEVALAASLGYGELPVGGVPNVAVIGSGNELIEPGAGALAPGQIYNSNVYALSAQITACGSCVVDRQRARDDRAALRSALDAAVASGANVIVTSGGVSVGQYDYIKDVVEEAGGAIDFWKVAIRPGKPFVFGDYKGCLFFGLPGNPVSTMVTFELFVRPALRRLAGHPIERCARPLIDADLSESAVHEPGRRSFLRAWAEFQDGRLVVRPVTGQGSHMITGMVRANSLLVLPEDCSEIAAGESAKVMLLD